MSRIRLVSLESLREGRGLGFDPHGEGWDTLFAVRIEGEIRAYRNRCPHLNVRMEYRKDRFLSADGRYIVCYAHNARFLPESGLCTYGPCLGEKLTPVEVWAENGALWIED